MKKTALLLTATWCLLLAVCVGGARADSPLGGPGPAFQNSGGISGNRTTFTGNAGALNNNQWNTMMNPNPGGKAPAADFGNCNSLILRCAQPKCAGCASMEIALPIVSGCVQSNPSCKQYGDALIQTLAAQMVSQATAKANEQQAAAAQFAAAQAAEQAAAQSAEQMEQMQQTMMQMQQQMQEQSEQSAAAVQAALEEQKQLAAEQAAAAAQAAPMVSEQQAVQNAAAMGVSPDVLAREQIGGQILTQLENADVAMKDLKSNMQVIFDYAGCDSRGSNCSGPKRVKRFKQLAEGFFDPYESVLEKVYEAVILAQSLGVDINDVYMMLSGSCSRWGKYFCQKHSEGTYQSMFYTSTNCPNGRSRSTAESGYSGDWLIIEEQPCKIGDQIPSTVGGCQSLGPIPDSETVQQNYLYPDDTKAGTTRIGCLSSILDNAPMFRTMKKQATIDIEVLRRMVDQDAPKNIPARGLAGDSDNHMYKVCSISDDKSGSSDEDLEILRQLTQKRTLTSSKIKNVCVRDTDLKGTAAYIVKAPITWCADPKWVKEDASTKSPLDKPKCVCLSTNGNIEEATDEAECNVERVKLITLKKYCEQNNSGKLNVEGKDRTAWDGGKCDCNFEYKTGTKVTNAKFDEEYGVCKCIDPNKEWPKKCSTDVAHISSIDSSGNPVSVNPNAPVTQVIAMGQKLTNPGGG